jgi:hypothetical protein
MYYALTPLTQSAGRLRQSCCTQNVLMSAHNE